METTLSVLIVSHGHGALLEDLLESLQIQSIPEKFDIHLVLNLKEPPATLEKIQNCPIPINLIQREQPKSLSKNLNDGISKTQSPFLLILNPDVTLPEDNLQNSLEFARLSGADLFTCPSTDMQGTAQVNVRFFPTPHSLLWPRLTSEKSRELEQNSIFEERNEHPFWLQGSYLFGPTSTFQEFLFDERFPLYFEDVDLCRRLCQEGRKIKVCRQSSYFHHFLRKSRIPFSRHFFLHLYSALLYFGKHGLS